MRFEICFIILRFLGYAWAAERFCKSCLETTKKKEILFVLLLWCGWSAASVVPGELSDVSQGVLATVATLLMLAQIVLPAVLVFILFQGIREKKILAASVILSIIILAGGFCDSVVSCLLLVWLHTLKKIPEPFLTESMLETVECISTAAVIVLFCGMTGRLADIFTDKDRKWYITLAIPLFVLTAVVTLVNWGAGNGVLVRAEESMGLYYDQLFSHLYIIILCALSMFGAVSFVEGINRIYLEQRKNGQYQAQIAAYKMLDEQYEQAERLRHDMKNHLIALGGLLEEQELVKMRAYLEKMKENGNLESGGELTGNQVVDALLYNKRKKAEAEYIAWECDVRMPKVCGIDEFDLCVLFGNILDNAIEACEKMEEERRRFINIQARMVKGCFLLEVKNSTNTAKLQGRKADRKEKGRVFGNSVHGKGRGIGLLNISDMVRRNQGVMNREEGEGIYTVSVLLPFKKSDDSRNGN